MGKGCDEDLEKGLQVYTFRTQTLFKLKGPLSEGTGEIPLPRDQATSLPLENLGCLRVVLPEH